MKSQISSDVRICAYTYVVRGVEYDLPLEASIGAFAKACDQVVVTIDPRFSDGTWERVETLTKQVANIQLHEFVWPLNHPGCDGLSKAYARELASKTDAQVLVQFDCDEILMPNDQDKLRQIAYEMTVDRVQMVGTGVLNWFNGPHVKWSEPMSKPRLSLNNGQITHGIPMHQRRYWHKDSKSWRKNALNSECGMVIVFDQEIPLYCAELDEFGEPVTDGAGYIYTRSGLSVPTGSWKCDVLGIEHNGGQPRKGELERFAQDLISSESLWIWHESWRDIPRKWEMKPTWHYLWGTLAGKYPEGVSSYKLNHDTGEPIDFYAPTTSYALSKYRYGITQEMTHAAVLRLDWLKLSKSREHQEWLSRRRTYGIKRSRLISPSRGFQLLRKILCRFRRSYEF